MKLNGLFLADYATSRDNLLHVVAGGITRAQAREFPAPCLISLAGLLLIDEDEVGEHRFRLLFRRVGERQKPARVEGTFSTWRKPDAPVEAGLHYALAVDLRPLAIPKPGTYKLTLFVDDRRLGDVSFIASLLPDLDTPA